MNLWNSSTIHRGVLAVLILLAIFLFAEAIGSFKSIGTIGTDIPPMNTISVNGSGEVVAVPDIATFSFTVEEEDLLIANAQREATDRSNKAIDFLKDNGVKEKDIKTTGYNIHPRYDYLRSTSGFGGSKRVLSAYVVSQSIQVKVRDTEDAGKLLSGIGELGVQNVSGLNFTNDNLEELQKEARDKAIEEAKDDAKALAKSLGVSLGRIVSYHDGAGFPPIAYARDFAVAESSIGGAPIPEIPVGENKIISNVIITFEIK